MSNHLVGRSDDYDGQVIVKTDRNYGGYPDLEALVLRSSVFRPAVWALRRLPWFISGVLDPYAYRIYDSAKDVPAAVWFNRSLVVEKFIPERKGEFYCLRQYLFCGSCEVNTLLVSPNPVIKGYDAVWRENVPEVPQALRDIRQVFGIDYGRFDYVLDGDGVVLFDINRTPTYDPSRTKVPFAQIAEKLAPGLWGFLEHGRAAPAHSVEIMET